ncbi:MAG: putative quinol monooxygenase [Gammaproteobacteria bacterium]|jgi:quinol monooxygenase YgiN
MIHVIAVITAKPGRRAEVLEAFRANIPAVRAEDGCIEYVPVVDADGMGSWQARIGEDSFVVLEKWRDAAALAAHAKAPHMAEYSAKTRDLVATRTIHVMSAAD